MNSRLLSIGGSLLLTGFFFCLPACTKSPPGSSKLEQTAFPADSVSSETPPPDGTQGTDASDAGVDEAALSLGVESSKEVSPESPVPSENAEDPAETATTGANAPEETDTTFLLEDETSEIANLAPSNAPLPPGITSTTPVGEEPPAPPVEINRLRGEASFPCRFVNPSRQIEVFACHKRGPNHETVVDFDPSGEEIYHALLAIGCRPTDYWNVTSPGDFLRNQGDRVLVLVRWTWEGKEMELPAEALLVDGDTRFSSFVRGFSFSAFDVKALAKAEAPAKANADGSDAASDADGEATAPPPKRVIPEVVEITLGATQRQQAVFSLLSHPTNLRGASGTPDGPPTRALQYWTMPPIVNPALFPDLPRLVEAQPAATLILRRVTSEAEIIRYARSIAGVRGEQRRLTLYDRLEPVAKKIDRLKARYEELGAEIRTLVEADVSEFFGDGQGDLQKRGKLLYHEGQVLCHRIQELYFTLYEMQETFRLEHLKRDNELHPEVFEMARVYIEDGLKYEVLIAAKERESHELRLRDFVLTLRVWGLELDRRDRMIAARLGEVQNRMNQLQPDETYLRKLFLEDKMRIENDQRSTTWRRLLLDSMLEQATACLDGTTEARKTHFGLLRQTGEAGLRKAKVEADLIGIAESTRWFENDLESDMPERKAKAEEELGKIAGRRKALEEKLKAVSKTLAELEAKLKGGDTKQSGRG